MLIKKKDVEYYIGIDIGNTSVGWAVTDTSYNLLRVNNHRTWGVRMFDEPQDAVERRLKRQSRRRLQRRKNRLNLLDELFAEEINKVDPYFFSRLKESQYLLEDKTNNEKFTLFNDIDFTDVDYHNEYPTIYHLRNELMNGVETDIRLVYLAIHHIVKYRGNFYYEGSQINVDGTANEYIKQILYFIKNELNIDDLDITEDKVRRIEDILFDPRKQPFSKINMITQLFDEKYSRLINNIFRLSLGAKCNMKIVFGGKEFFDASVDANEFKKVQFDESYEAKIADLEDFYGDYFALIELSKCLYDAIELSTILVDGKGLSESKVISYEQHGEQLKELKSILKAVDAELGLTGKDGYYYKVLKADEKKGTNYVNYSGNAKEGVRVSREEFYAFLKKQLKKLVDKKKPMNISDSLKEKANEILKLMELNQYLPLQRNKDNSLIPYQLHKQELEIIIEKQKQYYPFLEKEEDGLTVAEKIVSLMTFRIPFYIGPLNNYHNVKDGTGYAWVEKKKDEKVLPWNFNEVIDIEKSAENFISNLVNMCTYLRGEQVLPKESILYSEFSLLNELNNIKLNGKNLDNDVKEILIEGVFKKKHKPMTKKNVLDYLVKFQVAKKTDIITGIDEGIESDMKSYRQMKQVLGDQFDIEMAENLIRWITIFNGEKKILKAKIQSVYGNALDSKMKEILKLSFKDWGRVSKKLLTEIRCESLHNYSIIEAMRETDNNFMELLSNKYDYVDQIEALNKEYFGDDEATVGPSILDELYVRSSIKRAIWQTIRIVEELKDIMHHDPKSIYISTPIHNANEFKAKYDMLKKYMYLNKDELTNKVYQELKNEPMLRYNNKHLILYYSQQGRCMYCGKPINKNDLNSGSINIEHIYPRSMTLDNSLENNLALVHRHCNELKGSRYPIDRDIRIKNRKYWEELFRLDLINGEKYNRLVRGNQLTKEELSEYISMQREVDSDVAKEVINILKDIFNETNIEYVKENNIKVFARELKNEGGYKFNSCKIINDYGYAKTAYLTAVVGDALHLKFTDDPSYIVRNNDLYSMNRLFSYDVVRNGKILWDAEKTKEIVAKNMCFRDIRITKLIYPKTGRLFNENLCKASDSKLDSYVPQKSSDETPFADVTRYGGYKNKAISYYVVFECEYIKHKKNKVDTIIVPIPIMLANNYKKQMEYVQDYLIQRTKSNNIHFKRKGPKLYVDSFVKIDGYYYYLGGKSGERICIDNGVQLIVPNEIAEIMENAHKIKNTVNRYSLSDELNIENYIQVKLHKELSTIDSDFVFAFDYLVERVQEGIFEYSKDILFDKLENTDVRSEYKQLDIVLKAQVLIEIIQLINGKIKTSSQLKHISVKWSRTRMSMNITGLNEFVVINQSVTGLFENRFDLLKNYDDD